MKCSATFIVPVAFEIQLCSTPEAEAQLNYQPKSIPYSKSMSASRSLFAKLQHTSNSISTFYIEEKLLICGDMSPNSGPVRTRSNIRVLNVEELLEITKTP